VIIDFAIYSCRNLVERFFNKLKQLPTYRHHSRRATPA